MELILEEITEGNKNDAVGQIPVDKSGETA